MSAARRGARRRSPLRLLSWMVLAVLAVPLLLLLAWVIHNRIDEAPSEAALALSAPYSNRLPDAGNGWLYMVGIDAPADADPIAVGRARVDAFAQRLAQGRAVPDEAEAVLFEPVLGYESPGTADGPDALCPTRLLECARWIREREGPLEALRDQHAVLLRRYRQLVSMQGFEELPTPSLDEPYPSALPALRASALAANFAALEALVGGRFAAAAQELAASIAFWQRAGAAAHSPELRLIALGAIERDRRILDGLVDAATPSQLEQMAVHVQAALAPEPEAMHDWRPIARYQYQLFRNVTDQDLLGFWSSLGGCFDADNDGNCIVSALSALGYARQATLNTLASHYRNAERILLVPAPRFEEQSRRAGRLISQDAPLATGREADFLLYNPAGKVLAMIALPTLDWAARTHDLDALRRMHYVKFVSRQEQVPAGAMAKVLPMRHSSFSDPYTLAPFHWDPVRQELGFAPGASGYRKRSMLTVPYRELDVPPVSACDEPVRIHLRSSEQTERPVELLSCATGRGGDLVLETGFDEDPDALGSRLQQVQVWREDALVHLRLVLRSGDRMRGYEASSIAADPERPVTLERLGHEAGEELVAAVEPVADDGLVTVEAEGVPARDLLEAIARAKGVQVRNAGRMGRSPFFMNADAIRTEDALTRLAQSQLLQLRKLDERSYTLEASER